MRLGPLSPTTPRILLVDDNRDGLVVRRLVLEEAGCQVETAGSPEEALRLFDRATFDVVVTDYRMPHMNGTELITRIRALKPEVRIILLSGWVEQLGFSEQNTGADAVIAKNSREAVQLVRWVRRLVNAAPRKKPISPQGAPPRSNAKNLAH
jgi:CheY-like chemotaxis protein